MAIQPRQGTHRGQTTVCQAEGAARASSQWPLGLLRTAGDLEALLRDLGEPRFRGAQVRQWVFRRGVTDPAAMTDLPRALRERLGATARASLARVREVRRSRDGTAKALLAVQGPGRPPAAVESVLIPEDGRLTLCVSSQAGCAVGCPFCASGQGGLVRNLGPEEIAGQVLWAWQYAGRRPTHVVFMGMGEPMANFPSVRAAIDLLRGPGGFGIAARRLTVSTAGHVPGIRRLAEEPGLQVGLAVSLHAPDDCLRNRLVPLNRAYPLAELLQACRQYTAATRRRVTFEYVLLRGVNDSLPQARALAGLVRGMLGHVNLIPYNPVPGLNFEAPSPEGISRFARTLQDLGVTVTVRWSRGADIEAACGQLRAAEGRTSPPEGVQAG